MESWPTTWKRIISRHVMTRVREKQQFKTLHWSWIRAELNLEMFVDLYRYNNNNCSSLWHSIIQFELCIKPSIKSFHFVQKKYVWIFTTRTCMYDESFMEVKNIYIHVIYVTCILHCNFVACGTNSNSFPWKLVM